MRITLRYRWLLAIGHTLLDLILLAVFVWHMNSVLKRSMRPHRLVTPAAFTQEDEGTIWEPRYYAPPEEFMLLLSGTMPAGVISENLRPGWDWRRQEWFDPAWLAIHEAIAIPFWFLFGFWIDSGRSRLGKPMQLYLGARGLFLTIDVAFRTAQFGTVVQVLFWFGLAVYATICGTKAAWRLTKRTLAADDPSICSDP